MEPPGGSSSRGLLRRRRRSAAPRQGDDDSAPPPPAPQSRTSSNPSSRRGGGAGLLLRALLRRLGWLSLSNNDNAPDVDAAPDADDDTANARAFLAHFAESRRRTDVAFYAIHAAMTQVHRRAFVSPREAPIFHATTAALLLALLFAALSPRASYARHRSLLIAAPIHLILTLLRAVVTRMIAAPSPPPGTLDEATLRQANYRYPLRPALPVPWALVIYGGFLFRLFEGLGLHVAPTFPLAAALAAVYAVAQSIIAAPAFLFELSGADGFLRAHAWHDLIDRAVVGPVLDAFVGAVGGGGGGGGFNNAWPLWYGPSGPAACCPCAAFTLFAASCLLLGVFLPLAAQLAIERRALGAFLRRRRDELIAAEAAAGPEEAAAAAAVAAAAAAAAGTTTTTNTPTTDASLRTTDSRTTLTTTSTTPSTAPSEDLPPRAPSSAVLDAAALAAAQAAAKASLLGAPPRQRPSALARARAGDPPPPPPPRHPRFDLQQQQHQRRQQQQQQALAPLPDDDDAPSSSSSSSSSSVLALLAALVGAVVASWLGAKALAWAVLAVSTPEQALLLCPPGPVTPEEWFQAAAEASAAGFFLSRRRA
jgi:hypothetical protein